MIQLIKKGAKLSEENRPLLWVRTCGVFCSIGFGMSFMVGAGDCCFGACMADYQAERYVLYDFCNKRSMGFYAILLGVCWWWMAWAFIVGGIAFWMGIKVHVNGLKWQWDELVYKDDDTIQWKQMFWSGPNASKHPLSMEN